MNRRPKNGEIAVGSSESCMRDLHKNAKHRKRRIIYNNDGDDATYHSGAPTAESMLATRTGPSLNTHVDTIFYCTSRPFPFVVHDTKVGEVFTRQIPQSNNKRNIVAELVDQGKDPLQITSDFCKKNAIEIFWSMRMNDIHDGTGAWTEMMPDFKKEHPDVLFGSEETKPPYSYWTGVDYAQSLVREKVLAICAEICENYYIDGLELDFWRHPPFFKRHAWGKEVIQEELDQMTELVQEIRALTKRTEREHKRPFLLATRIIESAEISRRVGLDVRRWLNEDLVDMLITGEVHCSSWEELISLGHQYDVPVYCCLRRSMLGDEHGSLESFRAQALSAWKMKADGIYFFNIFQDEGYDIHFRELGDPQLLERLDKRYYLDSIGGRFARYVPDYEHYVTRPIVSPKRPLTLAAGVHYKIPLFLADAALADPTKETAPKVTLSVYVQASEVCVLVNGHVCQMQHDKSDQLVANIPILWLHTGYNLLTMIPPKQIAIHDIVLDIKYGVLPAKVRRPAGRMQV